jgi:tetratricopeptide (TPR) repeat protein
LPGIPFDNVWTTALIGVVEIGEALGDTTYGDAVYHALLPYADRVHVLASANASYGALARHVALVAWRTGRFEEAERHFETAIAINRRIGAESFVARTQSWYARCLLERATSSDRERADDLVSEARSTAERLGLGGVLGELDALGE